MTRLAAENPALDSFREILDDSRLASAVPLYPQVVAGMELSLARTPLLPGLGMTLADRLGATVGSELTVVSPVGVDAMMMQIGQPLTRKCTVVGIYDSHNKDYDAHYAYISLPAARDLFRYQSAVSGVDISRFSSFVAALEQRRDYFRSMGATATDTASITPDTTPLNAAGAEKSVRTDDSIPGGATGVGQGTDHQARTSGPIGSMGNDSGSGKAGEGTPVSLACYRPLP